MQEGSNPEIERTCSEGVGAWPSLGAAAPEPSRAPHDRLFAVLGEPNKAVEAIRAITEGIVHADIWVYVPVNGARAFEVAIARLAANLTTVRLAPRLLTSDCAYCVLLNRSVHEHGMVLAIRLQPPSGDAVRATLRGLGAHSIGYGPHWSFAMVATQADGGRGQRRGSTK